MQEQFQTVTTSVPVASIPPFADSQPNLLVQIFAAPNNRDGQPGTSY